LVDEDWEFDVKDKFNSIKKTYLREMEIFQDLTLDEIKELENKCHFREVAAGTVFYELQQAGEMMFFIRRGRVRLYHFSPEGKTFTTAILEAGAFFGETTRFGGRKCYGSYAEAVTACAIYAMNRADVETFLLGDRRIALRIVEVLSKRLIEAEHRLADSVLKNIPSRLVSLLLRFARQNDSTEVYLTHEELAQLLGTRRETVTRILNEMESSQGSIALHRGRITLLDVERLNRIGST